MTASTESSNIEASRGPHNHAMPFAMVFAYFAFFAFQSIAHGPPADEPMVAPQ
jgi:hypothetical protein